VKRVLLVPLLALGCAKIDRVTLGTEDLPPEVTHVAVLALGDDGELQGASGLLDRASPNELAIDRGESATRFVIHGYRAEQLEKLSLPAEEERRRSPLRKNSVGDPALPEPVATLTFDEEGSIAERLPAVSLTAAWLPRCAIVAGEGVRADIRCAGCAADVVQTGCALTIANGYCTSGAEGTVGTSEVSFEASSTFGRCSIQPHDDRVELDCNSTSGSCRIDLRSPGPPVFDFRTVEVAPGPFVANADRTALESSLRGRLLDLLATTDGLFVAEPGGAPTGLRCPATSGGEPGVLHHLGHNLEPIATATTPPCLVRLLPGEGGRILAIAGIRPQRLIELEPDGTVTRELRLEGPELSAGMVVVDIVEGDPEQLAILFASEVRTERTKMWIVDRRALARIGGSFELHPQARLLYRPRPGIVGVVIADDDALVQVDVLGGMIGAYNKLDCYRAAATGFVEAKVVGGGVWLASRRPAARLIWADTTDFRCEQAPVWERDAQLDTIALDPINALGWVGSTTFDPAETSYLSILDTDTPEILGGGTMVGRGPLSRLTLFGAVLYGILPGTGEVLRAAVPR
jgi:hypothetical protein